MKVHSIGLITVLFIIATLFLSSGCNNQCRTSSDCAGGQVCQDKQCTDSSAFSFEDAAPPTPGGFGGGSQGGSSQTEDDDEEEGEAGDLCSSSNDCESGLICWNNVCVGDGELRFSLSWDVDTDYDLHVITPGGSHLYFGNSSGDGGYLDVDDCVGAICRTPGGTHVENITFPVTALPGTYTFFVNNFDCELSTDYKIEVGRDGHFDSNESGVVPLCGESEHYTYEY